LFLILIKKNVERSGPANAGSVIRSWAGSEGLARNSTTLSSSKTTKSKTIFDPFSFSVRSQYCRHFEAVLKYPPSYLNWLSHRVVFLDTPPLRSSRHYRLKDASTESKPVLKVVAQDPPAEALNAWLHANTTGNDQSFWMRLLSRPSRSSR
jgi:hypothetical protein